jgi:hypothetical protein
VRRRKRKDFLNSALLIAETLPTIMKIYLLILLFGLSLISCVDIPTDKKIEKDISTENILNYIDTFNEIEISQTDDKYGEWGGDSDIIRIYSDGENILADYSRYLGSMEPPTPPKENKIPKKWYEFKKLEFKIDSIKLNIFEKQLVEIAVLDLLQNKIRNETSFSNFGINNRIVSKDSSLIINDYNSIKWKSFQKLKNELDKK